MEPGAPRATDQLQQVGAPPQCHATTEPIQGAMAHLDRATFLAQAGIALDRITASAGSDRRSASDEWNARMAKALRECALAGARNVALFGAGTPTRALGETLREPPVRIMCIIDDGAREGQTLWGFPVFTLERASMLPIDTVILSGNSVEDALWERAAPFRTRGIPVVRLYTQDRSQVSASSAAA